MESDDLTPRIPLKRSRSPSTASIASTNPPASASPTPTAPLHADNDRARPPAPKRLRRSHEVPDYHAPVDEHARRAMAGANPLSRRVLKQEAKKARRAANRAAQLAKTRRVPGMDVDDDEEVALGTTFMGQT